jgi:hypothetical protein
MSNDHDTELAEKVDVVFEKTPGFTKSGRKITRVGRKTKFTRKNVRAILKHIQNGNYQTTAAKAMGVKESTFHEWKRKYPEFSAACDKAEQDCEANLVEIVYSKAKTSLQAAQWLLERKFPDRFGKLDKTQNDTRIAAVTQMSEEDLKKAVRSILSKLTGQEDKSPESKENIVASEPVVVLPPTSSLKVH